MIRVRKIAHASYEVPDVEKLTDYYTNILGMTLVAREKDTTFLANTIDHHSVVLHKGPQTQCLRIGFQIGEGDDLAAFEKQVQGHGIKTARKKDPEPSISELLTFEDPKGTVMEVFRRADFLHRNFQTRGIVPLKLGHVAFHVTDVQRTTKFYCDVLGFQVSDWMGDYFSFLRCGPDHHTINLIETGSNRHFHTAFELRDWSHMQTACDFLSLNGCKLIWGPGRHGPGHNLFSYHRSPAGLITELYAELDRMNEDLGYFEPRPWHRDHPQRPKVWAKDSDSANLWGIMPTDDLYV